MPCLQGSQPHRPGLCGTSVLNISPAIFSSVVLLFTPCMAITRVHLDLASFVHVNCNWTGATVFVGCGHRIRSLLLHPRTDLSSWASTQLRAQKYSTKHGLWAIASSSCGWCSMIDAGLLIVANGMGYRMTTHASCALSCRRPLITCLWAVPSHGRSGLECYGS